MIEIPGWEFVAYYDLSSISEKLDTPWPGDKSMTELPWPEGESTPPKDKKCFNFYTISLIRKRNGPKELSTSTNHSTN